MLNVMSKRKNEKESPERSDKRKTTVLGVAVVLSLVTLIALVVLIGPRLSGFLVAGTEFSHQQAIGQEFSSNANYTLQLEKLPSENFTLKSLMVSGSVIGDGSAKVYLVSGDMRLRVFDSSNLKEKISPITAFSVAEQPEVSVQPELPPSSELDNAQGGAGTDTTPAGSPGAENPPADVPPAEQPAQPAETPTNETLPIENLTQEVSPANVTNETLPAENITNITEALLEGKPFQNLCIDTCSISEFLNERTYTLEIEVEPGTILALDSATYTLLIPKTEETNISNETVFFVTNIEDSKSNKVNAVIEFVDPSTSKIEAVGLSEQADKEFTGNITEQPAAEAQPVPEVAKPTLMQGAAIASEDIPSAPIEEQAGAPGLDIPKGTYKIKVKPQNMPVTEIVFDNIDISQNVTEFIKLDNVHASENFVQAYAIDPTAFNFTSATVTVTAQGSQLYKCKDWDFANQTCLGEWSYLQDIIPGQVYSFTLTPEDPGFGENATGTPSAMPPFYMALDSYRASNGGGSDSADFSECPVQLNDYGQTTEKCGRWNCTGWLASGTNDMPEYCSGSWNCTKWNGVTCAQFACTAWSGGTAQYVKACKGGWNCTSWNGNYCSSWGCLSYSDGTAAAKDEYCSGILNCTTWNSGKCSLWNCTAWGSSGTADRDVYCSGNWNCTSWSGGMCGSWNCTTWTISGTNDTDLYCANGWNCTEWNNGVCGKWVCLSPTIGASQKDYYCPMWNCSSWDATNKVCKSWVCPSWNGVGTSRRNYYCSGNWNCSYWEAFTYLEVKWNQQSLDITGDVNASNVIGAANITSLSANSNITVTCASGNCTKVTNDWVNGTNMTNNEVKNVNFTCNSSEAGIYSALFNLTSNEDATPNQINVSCIIIAPVISWSQSTLGLGGVQDSIITGTANITSLRTNHNVVVSCTSGDCSKITSGWTNGTNMTNGENDSVTFTCNSEIVTSYSAIFSVVSTEDTSPDTINASCTISQKPLGVYVAHPDPVDKDKVGKYAVIVSNPTSSDITVTTVWVNASTAVNQVFNAITQGAGSSYPTSGWAINADKKRVSWSGSETVSANSAKAFWINIKSNRVSETFPVSYEAVINSTTYKDPNSYSSQELNGNLQFTTLAFTNSTTYPLYVETASGSVEKTYNISLEEDGGYLAIPSGVTLTVVLPSAFTNIKSIGGTGWATASIVGQTITVNTNATVLSSRISYSFNATANKAGMYVMNASMSGSGARAIFEGVTNVTDNTPPASITNLANQSAGYTWIYWNWTNPANADFSKAIVYVNGSNVANTSNNYYNATGLTINKNYTITVNTVDVNGNVNNTNVSNTAKTPADTLAPTYSNDADNSSGSVYDNKTIAVSVYWQDGYQLGGAIFRTNQSGSWANISTCALSGVSGWCNQTINASGYFGKTICWNQYANDTIGNLNATMTQTAHCFSVNSSDITPPTVTPNSPADNSVDGDGSVLFNCSAADTGTGLASISLYINSILNQTNTVTGSSNSTTFSKTLVNGNYTWYCRAADVAGNANNSTTYHITVNTAAVPVTTKYSGNTTNWAAQPDLSNICTATLDVLGIGQIRWYNCVDASFQNFDTNVNISNNFVDVNFGLNPTFNSSAQITIKNLTWEATPDILMNGVICDYVNVCQNITYDNVTGVLTFDTTHFTNFSTVGNSRLVIWDQNDSGMPGGNLPACLGSQIKFFANYSRTSNSNPITGATCIVNFTDTTNNAMPYNGTSLFYEYNRTFSTIGNKPYIIRCSRPTFQTITLSDNISMVDCTPPQWSNNQSSIPAKYNASQPSVFNITWADNVNVSAALIEGNWSGSPVNYTATLISGNTSSGVWSYNATLPAGTFYWKSYANDTSNNRNTSNTFTFTIAKADNSVNLYLNGTQANSTYTYPQAINATGTALNGTVFLYRDATLLASGTSPQTNISVLGNGTYAYKVNATGNTNYSDNSTGVTYYAFVNKATSTCSLSFNPVSPITYGIAVNVSCSCTNLEAPVQLYRNSTDVTSEIGQNVTLGVGTWSYVCNVSQTQNYTSATNSSNFAVNPASSQVNLLLDGTASNKTVEVGSTVNLTATMITPSTGVVQLYRNGTQINNGSAPITNLSTFSTLEAFNITAVYPATQNYSSSFVTYYVITQDTTKPNIYLTSPGNNTAIAAHSQSFVFNATDNYYTTLNCTLYINNVPSGTNSSVTVSTPTTIINTSIPEGNNNWYVNCTDGSGNRNQSETRVLTVDVTPPVITHVRPVQNEIVGYNVTLDVDITDNLLNVSSAWYEISNSSGIVNSGTLPGPNYQSVWDSRTVQDGGYTFRAYANDTLGNQANSSVNFTVDNTAPFIQILTPQNSSQWNSNFNLNVTIQNTRINASNYSITNSTSAVVQSNSNNSINSPTFSWTDAVNVNSLPTGTYLLTVYALDSVGYVTTKNSTFIIDHISPQYSNIAISPASPATYLPGQSYQFNATWTDNIAVDTVIFEFNGTNYTDSIQNGNVYSKNLTNLPAGNYSYKWYANDTTGNWNSTGTFTYIVNKASPAVNLLLDGVAADKNVSYTTQTNATGFETNVGDSDVTFTLYRNGVAIGNGSSVSDVQTLGANTYIYTYNTSGGANYTSATISRTLTVNKQITAVNLYLNGNQSNLTISYPAQSNVTATDTNGTLILYQDGVNVSNPDVQILGAGTYNYTAVIPDDANRTGSSKTFFLTVNKQITAVNLYLNGNQSNLTITYGAQSNVTATDTNGTLILYRNGANVSNPDIQTLAAGTYNYTAVIPDDANRTGSVKTYFLAVQKATPNLNLLLNGTASNLTVSYPTPTNATAFEANTGDSDLTYTLYRDSTTIGSGATVFDVQMLGANIYVYTYNTSGGANYTSSTVNRTLTVNKQVTAVNLYLNGNQSNLTISYPAQSNVTATDTNGTLILYRNGANVSNPDIQNLGAGTYNYTAVIPDDVNRTGSSKTFFLTVNKQITAVNLYLNGNQSNLTITYGAQSNVTATDTNGTLILYRDGVNITNPDINVLSANVYNYTAVIPDDVNRTGSSKTFFLTINKATPAFSLLINGNDSDASVSVLTPVTINASATAPAGANVELYEDNGFVANGSAPSALRNYATPGNRTWKVNISTTQNYTSGSKNHTVVVFDNTSPQYSNLVASPASPATYSPSQNYQFNATWLDNVAVSYVALQFNGTNYSVSNSSSVYYKTFGPLAVGNYSYTWYANDTSNNWNNTGALTYTINKATPVLTLAASPSFTNTYGTQTNISCTADTVEVTPQLFRNGASVLNPDVQTLGANVYNYTCNNTATQNYTTAFASNNLTINKAADMVNLYLNGNQSNLTISYGTQSNATATSVSGTQQLYRDNVPVSNPEIAIFGFGTYAYKANSTGNANYTASAGVTYYLNVTKISSSITLLLNGTNGDFIVNRSQTANITGIRNIGEGSMQLYDNGTLINSGAPVITNITSYAALGPRNITLNLPETQNYSASTAMHFLSVYGTLSAYVTAPTGTPKYYEGQNITFKGYVRDDLGNPVDGATVTFEPINGSYVYVCSSSLGEGSGVYNCTLDTTGMASPRAYNLRINATKTNYHLGTYTNSSIFFLESGQKANLLLHKIPSVQSINSSQITYNISLHLANGRGTSDNTTLKDPDANQTWNEGSIYGAQEVIESYLLTYNRGSSDSIITLQKANVTGYDPFYNTSLFAESNQPSIIVPQNITGAQLTLVKNILFVEQTTTNITYTVVDTIVNSGGSDLSGIPIVDSDISLTTTANIARGNSATYSGNKTITKNSQSYTYNFTQTSAFANSQFFYSNQPSIQIPGYGGPYDVVITSLPGSVNAGSSITGVVEAINMNTEVSEDRTLTTWIEDSNHTVLALDVRTIFIGRNQSATATITLTAPSTAGTYYFVSKLTWPTADANATKAFTVLAVQPPTPTPAPGAGGGAEVVNITNVTIIQPIAVIPNDIIQDLITLINAVREIEKKPMDEQMQLLEEDIEDYIVKAEDAAAQGKYDEARNDIRTAYGKLQIYYRITPSILPTIKVSARVQYVFWGTLAATVIFIMVFFVRKMEEEAAIELLREERKHLEKLYDKVDNYLNRKRKNEHEV
jgi:hypothetical protein